MVETVLESVHLITNGIKSFRIKCLNDMTADKAQCLSLIENSLSMVTSLAPRIGYDLASQIAKRVLIQIVVFVNCLERLED